MSQLFRPTIEKSKNQKRNKSVKNCNIENAQLKIEQSKMIWGPSRGKEKFPNPKKLPHPNRIFLPSFEKYSSPPRWTQPIFFHEQSVTISDIRKHCHDCTNAKIKIHFLFISSEGEGAFLIISTTFVRQS